MGRLVRNLKAWLLQTRLAGKIGYTWLLSARHGEMRPRRRTYNLLTLGRSALGS